MGKEGGEAGESMNKSIVLKSIHVKKEKSSRIHAKWAV